MCLPPQGGRGTVPPILWHLPWDSPWDLAQHHQVQSLLRLSYVSTFGNSTLDLAGPHPHASPSLGCPPLQLIMQKCLCSFWTGNFHFSLAELRAPPQPQQKSTPVISVQSGAQNSPVDKQEIVVHMLQQWRCPRHSAQGYGGLSG